MEKIQDLAAEILSLTNGEHADEIKARVSAIVAEAQSLSNAYALAVASAPKGDATSPAPKPDSDATVEPSQAAPETVKAVEAKLVNAVQTAFVCYK